MTAIDLFGEGRLGEAVEAQLKEVRANPADPGRRLFLVELLNFTGDLDRARRQLEAIALGEPRVDRATRDARDLLDSEAARRRVFDAGEPPSFLGDPPEHCAIRLEGLERLRAGHPAEAAELFARAAEAAPGRPGTLDGRAFAALRDTDDRLASVLEVFARGKYYWVGLEQVVSLAMNPPKYTRDLWAIPARLELDEQAGEVFLPALYPGAHLEADDGLRLGRLTEWRDAGGVAMGVGGKVLQVGDDDLGLIDWRQLAREGATPAEAPAPAPPVEGA